MSVCDKDSAMSIGSTPSSIKWNIVRGDSSLIRIEFLEKDELTPKDMSTWTFLASAYEPKTKVTSALIVNVFTGYIEIFAPSELTATWGTGVKSGLTAELSFDLQITITDQNKVWTPVIGTISVIADVTANGI